MKIYNVYYQEDYDYREDSYDPAFIGSTDNREDAEKLAMYASDLNGGAWIEEVEIGSQNTLDMIKAVDESIEKNGGLKYYKVEVMLNMYDRHRDGGGYDRSWVDTDKGIYPRIESCYPFYVKYLTEDDDNGPYESDNYYKEGVYNIERMKNLMSGRVYCHHGNGIRYDVFQAVIMAKTDSEAREMAMNCAKDAIKFIRNEEAQKKKSDLLDQ